MYIINLNNTETNSVTLNNQVDQFQSPHHKGKASKTAKIINTNLSFERWIFPYEDLPITKKAGRPNLKVDLYLTVYQLYTEITCLIGQDFKCSWCFRFWNTNIMCRFFFPLFYTEWLNTEDRSFRLAQVNCWTGHLNWELKIHTLFVGYKIIIFLSLLTADFI